MNGVNNDAMSSAERAYYEALYELDQMITRGDAECERVRTELRTRAHGITRDDHDLLLNAKVKAIYNYIASITN